MTSSGICENQLVFDVVTGKQLVRFEGSAPSWSPDGAMLAISDVVWNSATQKRMHKFPTSGPTVWSPNGKQLARTDFQFAYLIDASSGTQLHAFPGEGSPMAWNSAGTQLATTHFGSSASVKFGKDARTVLVWNVAAARKSCELPHLEEKEPAGVSQIVWNRKGTRIATTLTGQRTLYAWDATSGKRLQRIEVAIPGCTLDWSSDGNCVRAIQHPRIRDAAQTVADNGPRYVEQPGKIREWNVFNGTETEVASRDAPDPHGSSPNGKMLAINHPLRQSLEIRSPIVFDPKAREQLQAEIESSGALNEYMNKSDSDRNQQYLAVAFSKPKAHTKIWDLDSLNVLATLNDVRGPLALSPDGQWLAAAIGRAVPSSSGITERHDFRLFNVTTGKEVAVIGSLEVRGNELAAPIWSPDSERIIHQTTNGGMTAWDIDKKQDVVAIQFGYTFDFSISGKRLAAQAIDRVSQLIIADFGSGASHRTLGKAGGSYIEVDWRGADLNRSWQ